MEQDRDRALPPSEDRAAGLRPQPPAASSRSSIPSATFAERWWAFLHNKSRWEDYFDDLLADGEEYDHFGTDDYDASLEIYGATNDWRLSEAQQRYLFGSGFGLVYVNHKDGWQTHYRASETLPVRGWRRRYVSDPTAATTNVLAGPPNPGYYEISYWPEGWTSEHSREWLDTGYMRVVPDPLDPFAQGDRP